MRYTPPDQGVAPYGSVEEPEIMVSERQSVPVHVASSDLKAGKTIGTEFGRARTITVLNQVLANSVTPGAQRLLARSLRRLEARIIVNAASGGTSQVTQSQTAPGAGNVFVYTNNTGLSQQILSFSYTFTASAVVANRFPSYQMQTSTAQVIAQDVDGSAVVATNVANVRGMQGVTHQNSPSGNVTLVLPQGVSLPPGGTLTFGGIADAGDTITNIAITFGNTTQSVTDGVIVGSREEIASGVPMTPGLVGGYLQIGDNLTYKSQAELWVAFPASNVGSVQVTVFDYQWASDVDSAGSASFADAF